MIYRTITVTPNLSNNQIKVGVETIKNISAYPSLTTTVRHNTVSDYELLRNKPLINSITLQGDKSFEDLGLQGISNIELENLLT